MIDFAGNIHWERPALLPLSVPPLYLGEHLRAGTTDSDDRS